MGFTPGLGRSPGGGNDNPLQNFCLENPMDRGAWQAIFHRVENSQTRLKQLTTHGKLKKDVYLLTGSEGWKFKVKV